MFNKMLIGWNMCKIIHLIVVAEVPYLPVLALEGPVVPVWFAGWDGSSSLPGCW